MKNKIKSRFYFFEYFLLTIHTPVQAIMKPKMPNAPSFSPNTT